MSDEADVKVGASEDKGTRLAALQQIISRSRLGRLAGVQYGGLRDIYTVAGYPHQGKVLFEHYWGLYTRGDVAGRIVDMPASTTWKTPPSVQEEGMDPVEGTEFTQAFGKLAKRLKLWSYLQRLDRLCGVGQYAVMFIGVRGVNDNALKTPLQRVSKPEDLIYLSVYSEKHAPIYNWVTDAGDERFGMPMQYKLISSTEQVNGTAKGIELFVHASRVLHAAEGVLEDDTFGRPRLERPLNRLFDLDKVASSTGEAYWQQVTQILQAKIDQDHEITEAELKDLDDKLSEMTHDLRRTFYGRGIDLSYLNTTTPNVSQVGDFYFSLIAGATGIPKRILFGSELGELASTQDQANYMGMISERQEHFAEPALLRAFIDRCIAINALPTPKKDGGEYKIVWPPLFEDSAKDRAQVNLYHAQTAAALTPVGGNPRELVQVTDEGDVELIEREPDEPLPLDQMFPPPPDPNHPDPNAPPEAGGAQPGKTGDNKPNAGGDNGPNPKPPSAGGGDKQTSKNFAAQVWESIKKVFRATPALQEFSDEEILKEIEQAVIEDPTSALVTDTGKSDAELYNPNHDDHGEFSSGSGSGRSGGSTVDARRSARAKSAYKPSTAAKQREAEGEQARIATQLKMNNTPDNEPFDLLGKGVGIEVKTLLDNNNDKITVHPESRKRKEAFAKQMRLKKTYTVVIDKRGGKRDYYIKEGVGAFRLKNMTKVSLPQMKGMF